MIRFHAYSDLHRPGLHVWRNSGSEPRLRLYLKPATASANGWSTFEAELDASNTSPVFFMLFEREDGATARRFESDVFIRELVRDAAGFPPDLWLFQDSKQISLRDPRSVSASNVRIHFVTEKRYRRGQIYIWQNTRPGEKLARTGEDALGPFWDLPLSGERQHYFNFKFLAGIDGGGERWEWTGANRTWTALAGSEIWVRSEAAEIVTAAPVKKELQLHFKHGGGLPKPVLHLWQESSDFSIDLEGVEVPAHPGWFTFRYPLHTGMHYGARFFTRDTAGEVVWEHSDVRRNIKIASDAHIWAFEGDSGAFTEEPKLDREITIHVPQRPPGTGFDGALFAHVWIDRARTPLHTKIPVDGSGTVKFKTNSGVTTSVKFHTDTNWETVDRHAVYPNEAANGQPFFAVLDRFTLLRSAPPAGLYTDPPFQIRRPGVYEDGGHLHFALHAPKAARVRLWGEWMAAGSAGIDLLSTRDRTFWWTRIPVDQVQAGLAGGDYHGAQYRYILDNDRHSQDPAAGWVVHSGLGANSRLVRSNKFAWKSDGWRRPTWDYLIVYQVHPSRFSARGPSGLSALERIAWEIEDNSGYFRQLGATALLLMPVHEFAFDSSWGYNPAFFYAVESSYGGPDALKKLVDTCHRHGIAVILDLVYNHAGDTDNPLWELARETFFDGNTEWGALVNFDHPQCQFFFAQNLAYLGNEYRLDGFRLDHTRTILHGDRYDFAIKVPGSGGGWDFLRELHRAARRQVGDGCIVIGEHLPNEWEVSNNGGPLDSQWNDEFHDRLEEAFRPWDVMGRLADAFKITHTAAREWFHSTNYVESHDEVGNENDRTANVAGFGRGLRAAKVAAAAVLLSRGIPMFFMGGESAEWRQFIKDSSDVLPLSDYLADPERSKVRYWWKMLCDLRRSNANFGGPAPLAVRFAQDKMLGFTRGQSGDYYVLLNFSSWWGHRSLAELNLPDGLYRELWNSTWNEFRCSTEWEPLRHNGGRGAQLHRGHWLHIPDTAAIILERI